MYKNMKKKMHFRHQLMIHLTVQSRGALEGTSDGAPNDALRDLHKDAQRMRVRFHCRLDFRVHLSCTCGCNFWYNE